MSNNTNFKSNPWEINQIFRDYNESTERKYNTQSPTFFVPSTSYCTSSYNNRSLSSYSSSSPSNSSGLNVSSWGSGNGGIFNSVR